MALPIYCRTLDSTYDVDMASRHIDSLTHNKILSIGWENLTEYQRETISKVCEGLAKFEYTYKDVLFSPYNSISINSVSVTYDFGYCHLESGVTIPKALYKRLCSTGLCSSYL